MKSVSFLSLAIRDLNEIIEYIALDDLDTALKVVSKIETEIGSLSEFPAKGKTLSFSPKLAKSYRLLTVEPYLVFYTVEENGVFIQRILHDKMNYLGLL